MFCKNEYLDGWFDNGSQIWQEPYIASYEGERALLLDDTICLENTELFEKMKSYITHRWIVLQHNSDTISCCAVEIYKL